MLMNVTVKMPPNMKKALEKLAQQEFSSVSGILKKAAEKYLLEHDINWREEGAEETEN
jgi:metal-responsive CopG/Arc/MetJ family transcriptional regulator